MSIKNIFEGIDQDQVDLSESLTKTRIELTSAIKATRSEIADVSNDAKGELGKENAAKLKSYADTQTSKLEK